MKKPCNTIGIQQCMFPDGNRRKCLVEEYFLGKGTSYFSESQGGDVEIIDLVFL